MTGGARKVVNAAHQTAQGPVCFIPEPRVSLKASPCLCAGPPRALPTAVAARLPVRCSVQEDTAVGELRPGAHQPHPLQMRLLKHLVRKTLSPQCSVPLNPEAYRRQRVHKAYVGAREPPHTPHAVVRARNRDRGGDIAGLTPAVEEVEP